MIQRILLLAFASFLLLTSCHKDDTPSLSMGDSTFSYLALGDSYTIGEDVPDSLSFPRQLESRLKKEGFSPELPTRIIAQTGWTTDNLSRTLTAAVIPPRSYSLATILIGVNDQYGRIPIQFYPERLGILIRQAESITGGTDRIIMISIPDYSVTPFAKGSNTDKIRQELEEYNRINRAMADSLSIAYVDITAISRKAATDLSYLAPDRLHPSGKMYQEWVDLITPVAVSILTK